VPGLPPGPGDPVGARDRGAGHGGLPFLPQGAQREVVFQQLPQHLPAPLAHELLGLVGGQPGRGRGGELAGQVGEHAFRGGERVTGRGRGIRCHGGVLLSLGS
jgi:hypothetical protein